MTKPLVGVGTMMLVEEGLANFVAWYREHYQ